MFDLDSVFEHIEERWRINDSTFVYVGKIRKDFFYQYVCTYDEDFYEPLSSRVNLMAFAEKVSNLSTTFVVVTKNDIAGVVASYFYDVEGRKGFITLVHTKRNYRGKHFARYLIESVKNYASSKGFLYIDLSVYKDNIAAFRLYHSVGFEVFKDEIDRCVLRCTIGCVIPEC